MMFRKAMCSLPIIGTGHACMPIRRAGMLSATGLPGVGDCGFAMTGEPAGWRLPSFDVSP